MVKKIKRDNITIKDIAEKCQVSIATISRVMNNIPGRYSAQTEARIRKTAEEMGYVPNVIAKSLVTQKTGLVAILIPDIHYYYYQELYSGLEDYFKSHDIKPILCITLQDSEREKQYIRSMSNGLVDGMVISTLNNVEDNGEIIRLKKKGFPIVTIERYGEELKNCCNIRGNNLLSSEMAVDYLYRQGHRRIAFIGGPQDAQNNLLRVEGFFRGMRKNRLTIDPKLMASADYQFESNTEETVELITRQSFTALIAANDLICVGACNILRSQNKRVPEDVSLIGLDNTRYMSLNQPPLTAVSFRGVEMGIYAGKCLRKLIAGKRPEQLEYIVDPVISQGKSVKTLEGSGHARKAQGVKG